MRLAALTAAVLVLIGLPAAQAASGSRAYFAFSQKDPKGATQRFIIRLDDPTRIAEARALVANSIESEAACPRRY
jgi:hypothetical protein